MFTLQEIRNIHGKYWKKGYGSISAKEALFLQSGIARYKPKRFIEIGTASGLSTGFIALFLHANGGDELITLDLDTTFWMDKSKPTGFLAEQIYPDKDVSIEYVRGHNVLYVDQYLSDKKFDMAFIDANHQHPWPTLDMICLLPVMVKGALIYHHDLALYKKQDPTIGIGPKYLFDQFSDEFREITREPEKNIYFIRYHGAYTDLQQAMIDSLHLPWTVRNKIDPTTIQSIADLARARWSHELAEAVLATADKFNVK
jgi:predicted O-methyltransferase YrrM